MRMSVSGSIRTMSVHDVLDWAARKRLRGELALEQGETTRKLQLDAGAVTGASSNEPTEYLGQMLINSGHLSEQALRSALAQLKSNAVHLGKILVLNGAMSEKALRDVLDVKIRESVYAALSWQDGTFVLEPRPDAPRPVELEMSIAIPALLTEGSARAVACCAPSCPTATRASSSPTACGSTAPSPVRRPR
jgi:hypothetical protein